MLYYFRKLFIGGIPPQAKPSDLKDYFSKYGEVQKVNIITDVYSGRSRGFAFLIFANQDSVNQVWLHKAKYYLYSTMVKFLQDICVSWKKLELRFSKSLLFYCR